MLAIDTLVRFQRCCGQECPRAGLGDINKKRQPSSLLLYRAGCGWHKERDDFMRTAFHSLSFAALLAATACAPTRPAPEHLVAPPSATGVSAAPSPFLPPGSASSLELPGQRPDGSVLLPNQWSLRPVGKQVDMGDFPINIAVHPGGRFAAVLHSGYGAHEILVVDIPSAQVVSRTDVHETFYGLEFTKDGRRLFCSGAGDEVVHSYDFQQGSLTNHYEIKLRDVKLRAIPGGLAVDRAVRRLYVANVWGNRVTRVNLLPQLEVVDILLGTNVAPLSIPPVTDSGDFDTEAANKREDASLYQTGPDDAFPYACRLDEKRQRLYVSLWAHAAIAVIDLQSEQVVAHWPTQEHPCEMTLTRSGKLLFVANSSRNTVTVLDTRSGRALETVWAALYPQAPPGSTPNSLALSPDEKMLFVANADNNTVAVFDIEKPGKSRSLGFIPVGWRPTSVRVTPDGKHLLVANGKGLLPKANPLGPQPGINRSTDPGVQYIARLFQGTLSIIDLPPRKEFEAQLAGYTAQAYRCSPLKPDASVTAPHPPDNPIPLQPGEAQGRIELRNGPRAVPARSAQETARVIGKPECGEPARAAASRDGSRSGELDAPLGAASPIQYCIYIIKENRTYDQVLGDLPQGNGDPKLCLFPERVTPNLHQIARQFVLLDNFYADAEVSAGGHEWSMAAYSTDFVEKMWRLDYGHNHSKKFPYPAEGFFPVAAPAGGYLWDRAREAGVSYCSYGEFVYFFTPSNAPVTTHVKALQGHIDPWYRGWDLAYPDVKRAARFLAELKRMEAEGDMPRLQIVRLPSDHTHGVSPGFPTPSAYVADNDLAVGQVVEAVSHSKFWPETAIFIVEDDAQSGPDHVDAHRTTAYVISPYTKRGVVDSTMYSTSSMLRTMELILGLKPMSQFDAAATPMFNSFQATPDLRPYQALPANVDLEERNSAHAWGGQIKMNFAREDAVDDQLLNEVVWRSVRGPDSPMPAPVRAAFVFEHRGEKDED
ncbi:MAG: beta-propeller fold lactonase family protein [Verrucomicrobiota bacterium]|jgi:DNA-binding beta-propeller fold protein YncE